MNDDDVKMTVINAIAFPLLAAKGGSQCNHKYREAIKEGLVVQT